MRQVVLVCASILLLIIETPAIPPGTRIFPRRATDDTITYNVGDTSYVNLGDNNSNYPQNNESTEEQQGYTYNAYNVPSTVNFHDIYSNNLALLSEEPVGTTIRTDTEPNKEVEIFSTISTDDESFHLSNVQTQFVEFHPKTQTIPPRTTPPPMFPPNVTYVKTEPQNTTTTTTSTTTEEPEENIEVIPIKKDAYQRGLLDLLFPAARVRTFKSVFDTFRRIMSHTFR